MIAAGGTIFFGTPRSHSYPALLRLSWGFASITPNMTEAYVRTTHGLIKADTAVSNGAPILTHDGVCFTLWHPAGLFSPPEASSHLVKTHSGFQFRVAPGHRIATLDDDLRIVTATPAAGVIVPRLVDPTPDDELDLLERITLPDEPARTRNPFVSEIKLDGDFGYFTGVMVGDGWVNGIGVAHPNHVMLANNDPDLVAEFYRIVARYGIGPVTLTVIDNPHVFNGHECESTKVSFSSARLAEFVRKEIGCGASNKRLPDFWPRTSTEFRMNLLAGLIDTDGTVAVCAPAKKAENVRDTQTQVVYHTTSPGLARDVEKLAYSLGLVATCSTSTTPAGKPAYQIVFNQESVARLRGRLDLRVKGKADALAAQTLGTARRRGFYAPPLPEHRRKELRKALWSTTEARERNWPEFYENRRKRLYGNVSDTLRKADPKHGRSGYGALLQDTATAVIREIPDFFESGFWKRWKDLVEDPAVEWEPVAEVEPVDDGEPALPMTTGRFTVSCAGLLVTSG